MKRGYLYLSVLAAAALTACGSGTVGEAEPLCKTPLGAPVICKALHVVKYGDSITLQSGQLLLDYLPIGSAFENHGVGGAQALTRVIRGVPQFEKGKSYVFSYGANECLKNTPVATYTANLRTLLAGAAGHHVVLEAPWRLTNPQYRCNERVDLYRAAVTALGEELNIPVVTLDMSQEHDRGGIHLLEGHNREREALAAATLLATVKD